MQITSHRGQIQSDQLAQVRASSAAKTVSVKSLAVPPGTGQAGCTPSFQVRQLLMHGVGCSPFMGSLAKSRGLWVHACLHTELGYTYPQGLRTSVSIRQRRA